MSETETPSAEPSVDEASTSASPEPEPPQPPEEPAAPEPSAPTAGARAAAPPGRPGLGARVLEYFTLKNASAELARLDEVTRAEIAESVAIGRQQMAAAEALFAVGHTVEALHLGADAIRATERAAERYARVLGLASSQESGDATWRSLVVHAGLSDARVRATERALAELDKRVVPALEKDVSPGHVDAFRELVRARTDIEEGVVPATLTRESLLGTRMMRAVTSSMVAVAVVAGAYFLLRPVEGTFVRASATWADSPDFRTDFVIDGDDRTMWLTPEFSGWVEVRVVPSITELHRIRLVNAGTAAVPDRGTHDYQLEIYANGRLEHTFDGSFSEEFGASATHEATVRNVERIRFVALTGYRRGSGLAELSWE